MYLSKYAECCRPASVRNHCCGDVGTDYWPFALSLGRAPGRYDSDFGDFVFWFAQLLAVSMVGEYIAKVFEEVKWRPHFIRATLFAMARFVRLFWPKISTKAAFSGQRKIRGAGMSIYKILEAPIVYKTAQAMLAPGMKQIVTERLRQALA